MIYTMITTSIMFDVYDNIINISLSRGALLVRRRTNIVIRPRPRGCETHYSPRIDKSAKRPDVSVDLTGLESVIINNCPIGRGPVCLYSRRYLQPAERHYRLINRYCYAKSSMNCRNWIAVLKTELRKVEHTTVFFNQSKISCLEI